MAMYYAVGEAIITTEPKGFKNPGQIQTRKLNQDTILKEGFKTKIITKVFTYHDEAMIYANSLEVRGNWKEGKQDKDAPILTFEINDYTMLNVSPKSESVSGQSISYYEKNLPIADLTLTRLEFLAGAKVPPIDLTQQSKNCLIL